LILAFPGVGIGEFAFELLNPQLFVGVAQGCTDKPKLSE
jgi:hypothetical protein